MIENEDQRALRRWISAGLKIPEVRSLHGDAGYLLNNMIAKYTLAADNYILSVSALQEMNSLGVDLSQTYTRRRFYGKKDNPFIYEHPVPAGVTRAALLQGPMDDDFVLNTLRSAGMVAVLLRREDVQLREAKLTGSMPSGWVIGDDPFARYHAVGIQLSQSYLRVKGAICR